MSLLVDLAYLAAAPVALPALAVKSARTGKYQTDLGGRFGFGPKLPQKGNREKRILLHCVSVGELNSVQTLVQRLLAADPRLRIVITTTTDTGTARARKLYGSGVGSGIGVPPMSSGPRMSFSASAGPAHESLNNVSAATLRANIGGTPMPRALPRVYTMRFPFDFSFAVENLFDRVQPDLAVLVELETWPNFLSIAQSRRVPVALINGRISDKSFPRYRAIRPLMAAMLRQIDWIGAQTDTIARRFAALGAHASRIEVLPTLKYDNAHLADHVDGQEALAAAMGLAPGMPLFAAGSTGPGEEETLLDTYLQLRTAYPTLRLAIAPRHPEVVPRVVASIEGRKLRPVLRSARPDGAAPAFMSADDVFILDTMGELRKLYALSFAAFVGRSLIKKGGGGSDMIEVAALGKPCCFGPFTANFAEVVELLLTEKTAERVLDGAEMQGTLTGWLKDPTAAQAIGERARAVIRRQQGSTDQYVRRVLELLGARG